MIAKLTGVFLAVGAFQGAFIALLLLSAPGDKNSSRRYLALLFCGLGLTVLSVWLSSLGLYNISGIFTPVLFLIGPMLYAYVSACVSEDGLGRRSWLLHLIPSALSLLYYGVIFLHAVFNFSDSVKTGPGWPGFVFWITFLIQLFSYLVASARRIKAWQETALAIRIRAYLWPWFRFLFISVSIMAVLLLVGFVYDLVCMAFDIARLFRTELVLGAFAAVLICAIAFYNMRTPDLLFARRDGKRSYPTGLSEAEKSILERVRKKTSESKAYLDASLSLPELADMVGVTRGVLSKAINATGNENFYDFLNRYRVDEACRMLLDKDCSCMSILDIAFESGFNSKSAFNDSFKRFTGKTPGQYRKREETET